MRMPTAIRNDLHKEIIKIIDETEDTMNSEFQLKKLDPNYRSDVAKVAFNLQKLALIVQNVLGDE